MALFAGIVVIENEELGKLVPPSTFRTMAILFGYILAMLTFNYALGVKGRNFMGWKNEAAIMTGFILVFTALFLPFAFPVSESVVTESWIPFRSEESVHFKPNWLFALIAGFALPLFVKAWLGIRAMSLWKGPQADQ